MPAYNYYPTAYQNPYLYQPQSAPQQSIIWISGEQEAAMYPIAPNNAVALWAKDGKTIYLKSADATGKPAMRVYDLVERTETAQTQPDKPEFATRNELTAILGAVDALKSEMEAMKGDIYGIAGKRKKKVEGEDE